MARQRLTAAEWRSCCAAPIRTPRMKTRSASRRPAFTTSPPSSIFSRVSRRRSASACMRARSWSRLSRCVSRRSGSVRVRGRSTKSVGEGLERLQGFIVGDVDFGQSGLSGDLGKPFGPLLDHVAAFGLELLNLLIDVGEGGAPAPLFVHACSPGGGGGACL